MKAVKLYVMAMTLATIVIIYPQKPHAQSATAETLLQWTPAQQSTYLSNSISMAIVIASQLDKTQSSCLERWSDEERRSDYARIKRNMRENPRFHPQAVVLWIAQHECGKIGD
jgi:hypothetical protein